MAKEKSKINPKDYFQKKMPLKGGKPACPPGKKLDVKTGSCVARAGRREWLKKLRGTGKKKKK